MASSSAVSKDFQVEELASAVSSLSLSLSKSAPDIIQAYSPEILTFAGWKNVPSEQYVDPCITEDTIQNMLVDCVVGCKSSDLPQLVERRELRPSVTLRPYRDTVPAAPKPNLLLASAAIMLQEATAMRMKQSKTAKAACDMKKREGDHQEKTEEKTESEEEKGQQDQESAALELKLLNSLDTYDVVCPRKPLHAIMAAALSGESWQVLACRPQEGKPLFMERTQSYETNPGSIGMLFENTMTKLSGHGYSRVYALSTALLGDARVLLTGEIDCVDSSGRLAEIKSKPAWAKENQSYDRVASNWIQAKLIGVETMATGAFTAQRGVRDGPVTFTASNIVYQSLEQYGSRVFQRDKEAAFVAASAVITQLQARCSAVGTVYAVQGRGKSITSVQEAASSQFPISLAVLRRAAAVCLRSVSTPPKDH